MIITKCEKVIKNELGEPCFRKFLSKDGSLYKDIPVTERGFVKELEVAVILKRSYFSEADFQQHTAFFIQKYKLEMPKDRALTLTFFKYDKKVMQSVCVRDFNGDIEGMVGTIYLGTTTIDIMSKNDAYHYGIKKFGKMTKISAEKAEVMVRDREVLGLFNDLGENLV